MNLDLTFWAIPLTAFVSAIFLHLIALKIFPKLGLLDFPERYSLKRNPIPYPTGVLAAIVFLPLFLWLESFSQKAIGVSVGIILITAIAFLDDRKPQSPYLRLATQIIVALIIFITGSRIYSLTNPLEQITGFAPILDLDNWVLPGGSFGPLPVLSGLFTLVWLGLTINALNWFDGIPGQVSVLSTIGFIILGTLALSSRVNQPDLALIAFSLSGLSLCALIFDFPPAKVLMGDSGAMFFGLMLGVLTIYAGGKVATAFLVLGVPLIDSAIVILYRLKKGKSPFKGNTSDEHLHHRLLAKGWAPRQIIMLTALLGSVFGITALFLATFEKFIAALLLLIIMVLLSVYSRHGSKA